MDSMRWLTIAISWFFLAACWIVNLVAGLTHRWRRRSKKFPRRCVSPIVVELPLADLLEAYVLKGADYRDARHNPGHYPTDYRN